MKKLIYLLLFSTVGFAQNYQYALGEAPTKTLVTPKGVNNQLEEIEYFKAYLLPIEKKATLQQALDTYGAVRLEKGDYSGTPITLHSNQKLYGHPAITGVPYITIAAGSSNVVLEDLGPLRDSDLQITMQAGGVISNCSMKTLKYCRIIATNAMLSENKFIDIIGTINFDCSVSGYFRNNRIIKHQSQGISNMLTMKGNTITPSYGNVNIHSNYLTSNGITTTLDNLQSSTFIGVDCESYGGLTRELFYAKNIGKMNLSTVQGGMLYNSPYGYYNIDAGNLLSIYNSGNSNNPSVIAPRTNYLNTFSYSQPTRSSGTVTGFNAYKDNATKDLFYNGTVQSVTVANPAALSNFTLGTQYTPWARPNWETLPDPLGSNWSTERVGRTDSTTYIQNLLNTNKVAELPEGVFYISSTLIIPLDKAHGIIGKGTGKTVICGLTDDFPLLTINSGTFGNITLANLTLQGGSVGLYADFDQMLWAYQNIKYVVFRNQTAGIQTHQIFGFDNCFLDNVSFVNCNKGFFQDPLQPYVNGVLDGCSYTDKTVFYKSQFINCGTALSMQGTRANNMNAWIDCKFDNGGVAFSGGGDSTIFANCDFTNFKGTNVIKANGFTMFNSNFYNNSITGSIFNSIDNSFEGCNFLDSNDMFTPDVNNAITCNLFNSRVTGSLNVSSSRSINGIISNSILLANPAFNKLFVNIKAGIPTVIINETPNPYPQFLVTQ
jgi:hypothetical protein